MGTPLTTCKWAAVLALGFSPICAGDELFPRDEGEVSIYSGLAAGGLGAHPAVGGSAGRAFSPYCMALIDTSYAPLHAHTLHTYPGVVTAGSRLFDFNFTMHVRAPLKGRWKPYGIMGGAFLFNTYDKQVIQPDKSIYFAKKSYPAFGFEAGAGVRYYVEKDWGIRMEYRYTFSSNNFSRVLAGVFYQFEGDLPFRFRRPRHGKLY